MNITQIKGTNAGMPVASRPSDVELQNEYNYILAENFTKKLLEKGLISVDEFDKIMEKNRRTFSPLFSRI